MATVDTSRRFALLVGLAVAANCGAPESPAEVASAADEQAATAPARPLADSDWRLVEFQSMDDASGTVQPQDPAAFTMRLAADGSVALQLDCNSATGTWSAKPSGDGSSGTFEFGPLAATQALCPPPQLDELVTRQAPWVRSYLLRDDRLYLSLMADGGVFAWEPIEPSAEIMFEAEPDPAIEAALRAAYPDYTAEMVEIAGRESRYVYSRYDLNGDGAPDALVYLLGGIFCGSGGCDLAVLQSEGDSYHVVSSLPIARLPVTVLPALTAGWHDLLKPESGGGAPPSVVRYVFDGSKYVEQDRSSADDAPSGTKLLVGAVSYDLGVPLQPEG